MVSAFTSQEESKMVKRKPENIQLPTAAEACRELEFILRSLNVEQINTIRLSLEIVDRPERVRAFLKRMLKFDDANLMDVWTHYRVAMMASLSTYVEELEKAAK